jgi:hypothetical protein
MVQRMLICPFRFNGIRKTKSVNIYTLRLFKIRPNPIVLVSDFGLNIATMQIP